MTQISNNVTGIYFKQLAQNKTNSASNVPVDTSQYSRDNLIKQYLDNLALQNKPQILGDNSKPIFTPTGIGDYENMLVKDATGKVVQEVKYTNEGKLMIIRYNLDEKKVDYQELLRWTSFCNAFIISLTSTIICNIPLKMYYQLAIGFVILFGLIYSIFEIVGRHLNKKWGKENE